MLLSNNMLWTLPGWDENTLKNGPHTALLNASGGPLYVRSVTTTSVPGILEDLRPPAAPSYEWNESAVPTCYAFTFGGK